MIHIQQLLNYNYLLIDLPYRFTIPAIRCTNSIHAYISVLVTPEMYTAIIELQNKCTSVEFQTIQQRTCSCRAGLSHLVHNFILTINLKLSIVFCTAENSLKPVSISLMNLQDRISCS